MDNATFPSIKDRNRGKHTKETRVDQMHLHISTFIHLNVKLLQRFKYIIAHT